ncbi:uncharacterized protein LOC110032451 [Phalaenopsis equestris]|uniref:uncharacterized protein LOC110032451 n=1 Tax=Phalaenopsis equestris TaxID=78828 RepID=UPI0009E2D034|nr:uncharacterized protein LOC110032451 [Phalaenopsis equestris]
MIANSQRISLPPTAPPLVQSPRRSRRKAAILKDPKRKKVRFAEIAGGKVAECAAIFCCCPCGLANLFFLAAVRLPAGLCCRAVQKRILIRRAKKKAKLFESGSGFNRGSSGGSAKSGSVIEDGFVEVAGSQGSVLMVIGDTWPVRSPAAELVEFEKEVWSKFCGRGFWRSSSQKDDL